MYPLSPVQKNQLQLKLMKMNVSYRQLKALSMLMDLSPKQAWSHKYVAQEMKLDTRHVRRAFKELINRKILIDTGRRNEFGNKFYDLHPQVVSWLQKYYPKPNPKEHPEDQLANLIDSL